MIKLFTVEGKSCAKRRFRRSARGRIICFAAGLGIFSFPFLFAAPDAPAGKETNAAPADAIAEQIPDAGPRWRDPFWPILFIPPSEAGRAAPAVDKGTEPVVPASGVADMFKIGPVVKRAGKFYATVNGFVVQTGEVVTVVSDGEIYKFIIERIDFKKIKVKPLKRQ